MQDNKTLKTLNLLMLLEGCSTYKMHRLAERLECSERTIYRLVRDLRSAGADVRIKDGNCIMPQGPRPAGTSFLNQAEKEMLTEIIESSNIDKLVQDKLLAKLGLPTSADTSLLLAQQECSDKLKAAASAISQKKQAMFIQYKSGSGKLPSDRLVEPFKLVNNNNFCLCFDCGSGQTKLFKIDRAESISLLPENWKYSHQHQEQPTDIFRMCGYSAMNLEMILDIFAANLLKDEYPQAARHLSHHTPGHYKLSCEIYSVEGAARYCISVLDHITVLQPPSLLLHLEERINLFQKRIAAMQKK
jgi:predicted DNA-binding transcriptional regulator YafY